MRDELLAAIEWVEHVYADPRRKVPFVTPIDKVFEFLGGQEFVVGCDDTPFAFIQFLFDWRAEIIAESRRTGISNILELVIKLIINSIYGKIAEAVGIRTDGKPPPTANPYYAAAITAWTRAELIRASLHNPDAVVAFMTDGIVTTAPLHAVSQDCDPLAPSLGSWGVSSPLHGEGKLQTVSEKQLGAWEFDDVRIGCGYFCHAWNLFLSDCEGKRERLSH